jgi:hypothetical protein
MYEAPQILEVGNLVDLTKDGSANKIGTASDIITALEPSLTGSQLTTSPNHT